jgi:hypothetical protein
VGQPKVRLKSKDQRLSTPTQNEQCSHLRARICKAFKEPRNRFPAWPAGTTTLFDVPPGSIGWRNRFLGSLNTFPNSDSVLAPKETNLHLAKTTFLRFVVILIRFTINLNPPISLFLSWARIGSMPGLGLDPRIHDWVNHGSERRRFPLIL